MTGSKGIPNGRSGSGVLYADLKGISAEYHFRMVNYLEHDDA